MATVAEINAAFDAIEPDLHQVVRSFVPSFFQAQAMGALDSQAGRAAVLGGVKKALAAAEKARAAHPVVAPAVAPVAPQA